MDTKNETADLTPEDVVEPQRLTPEEAEMHVPGGATDPLWYLAADESAPNVGAHARRVWTEGFVAGLEQARGIDGAPGVAEVLRNSLGMAVEVPVAVRQPTPVKADAESIGKFLFERLDAEESGWEDEAVRNFWMDEARALMRFLP